LIALSCSESYAQERSFSIGFGYEYTGAASPLTRSNAATVELQRPIGESRFTRLFSMSFGEDKSGFYGRAPGGFTVTAALLLISAIARNSPPLTLSDLKTITLVPDGLGFDLLRTNKLRAGVYGDFLTFDYRGGNWYYTPDVGLSADFQVGKGNALFVRGAAKHFSDDPGWAPQIRVGIGHSF
jgi:hypothetical protein